MALGGGVGMTASFLQTLEKIQLLKNKDATLFCDVNSIFNCSSVLEAWQSSVFGFPNSLMCLILFTIFTTVALVGVSGTMLPRRLRFAIQLLSLFTLSFAIWFLTQSIYAINALCILCIFCFVGLLLINWGWLRSNAAELPIGHSARTAVRRYINVNKDTLVWITIAVVLALAMVAHFI